LSRFTKRNTTEKKDEENNESFAKMKELLKMLYDHVLKDDPKFHFFYEPEIIIRFSSHECLERAKSYLTQKGIGTKIYDYPLPDKKRGEKVFGEEPDGIVMQHFELFLTIFHAHSVAAIIMEDQEHFRYMERVIHTMWNPRLYTREQEGKSLAKLAVFKCGFDGVHEVMQTFDPFAE